MRRLREILGLIPPLAGLENILAQVANGTLAQDEAAKQIRDLADKPHIPVWCPRFIRIIGALFAIIGLGFTAYCIQFSIGTKEVQGSVVEMVGFAGQSPLVEYHVGGKRFTIQSAVSSSPPAYIVGEKVSILYRPDDPTKAQINSFTERWLFPVAFTSCGVMAFVMSFFLPKIISVMTGGV